MAIIGRTTTTVAKSDFDVEDLGPTVEEWHRELLQREREADYRAAKREAQLAMVAQRQAEEEFPF